MELISEQRSDSEAQTLLIGHVFPNCGHSHVTIITFTISIYYLYYYLLNIFL